MAKDKQGIRGILLFVVLGAVFVVALFSRQSDISDIVFTNKELVEAEDFSTESAGAEAGAASKVLPEDNLCNALAALEAESSQAEYAIQMQAVQQRLLVSDDPEHILTAALLEEDVRNQVRLIGRLFAATSKSALVVWHSLLVCSSLDSASAACPTEKLEQRLLALAADNSEAWVNIAANRHARGDHSQALEALGQAGAAASSSAYWADTIEMVHGAIAVAGDFSFAERVQYSFGIAGSNLPTYDQVTNMCSTRSADSADWARACLAYGELLEGQAETAMGAAVAQDIQSIASTALKDEVRLSDLKQRSVLELAAKRSAALDPAAIAMGNASEAMLLLSPAELANYLADVRKHGEIRAQVLSQQRVPAFIKRTGLDECAPWLDATAVQ